MRAKLVRAQGGKNIEGPQYFDEHHSTFYAVFFEDPLDIASKFAIAAWIIRL